MRAAGAQPVNHLVDELSRRLTIIIYQASAKKLQALKTRIDDLMIHHIDVYCL